jgi:hypothetical protein
MKNAKETGLKTILFSLCLNVSTMKLEAQTGGTFDLSHNVIAGGGSRSVGGQFTVEGTAGQNLAGTLSGGGTYRLRGGFWAFVDLTPTAAHVSVSGRVSTAAGQGITNVIVTLTGPDGIPRSARTASFGYYRFENVTVGNAYLLTVTSKRFVFINPTHVITVNDEVTDADFIAEPF